MKLDINGRYMVAYMEKMKSDEVYGMMKQTISLL